MELFRVLPSAALDEIVRALPKNKDELTAIKGIKDAKYRDYGAVLLELVAKHTAGVSVSKVAGRIEGASVGENTEGGRAGGGQGGFFLQSIRCLSGPGWHGIISCRGVATPRAVGRRTVGRVMSRTVFWLVGGGAIVIAIALAVAWQL